MFGWSKSEKEGRGKASTLTLSNQFGAWRWHSQGGWWEEVREHGEFSYRQLLLRFPRALQVKMFR